MTISDVAEFFGISKDHLAKVVQRMVQLGYVRSIRESMVELSCPERSTRCRSVRSSAISEGAMHYLECVGAENQVCVIQPGCGLKSVLAEAERLQWEYLDSVMLASVARRVWTSCKLTKPAL